MGKLKKPVREANTSVETTRDLLAFKKLVLENIKDHLRGKYVAKSGKKRFTGTKALRSSQPLAITFQRLSQAAGLIPELLVRAS